MKSIYLGIFIASIFVISCNNDDKNENIVFQKSLIATVDGESFMSNSEAYISSDGSLLTINGSNFQEVFSLRIANFSGEGTYVLTQSPNWSSYTIILDSNDPANTSTTYLGQSGNGELVVTRITGSKVMGTFSFIGINPLDSNDFVVIENGVFNTPHY